MGKIKLNFYNLPIDIPVTLSLDHPVSGTLFLTAFAGADRPRKEQERGGKRWIKAKRLRKPWQS
jgi:hypothetical protein